MIRVAVFSSPDERSLNFSVPVPVQSFSEGGETSSVIGTGWGAFDAGATVFFVFNNPAE